MPTERGWTQVGPGKTKGAPADVYNNSHQQIAAAASNPDLTSSQTDAAAASNIGLTEDGVGPVTWKLPDTERADIKSGKSSFDVLGQIIKPSQGPFTSDYYPGLLSFSAALNAAGPSLVAYINLCVRIWDSSKAGSVIPENA
ncbi:TPA: hypothetical protein ACH3X1_001839 [Trebouxia sp. C0004]